MKISQQLRQWNAYRSTVRELRTMNDRELADIGISASDIETIARQHARGL